MAISETPLPPKGSVLYTPKGGKILKPKIVPSKFYTFDSVEFSREVLLYLFLVGGERIKSQQIASKEFEAYSYYLQEGQEYFDDQFNSKYRNGYYHEGREILHEFRATNKKEGLAKIIQYNNEELCKMLSAHLFLKTALLNGAHDKYRCSDGTVTLLGLDVSSNEYLITSNYVGKLNNTCTLQTQALKHNKRVSATHNRNVCHNNCGKSIEAPCAETKFIDLSRTNNLIDPKRSILFFDYKNSNFGSCIDCDLLLRTEGLPLYMNLSNPHRVFINPSAPKYEQTIEHIKDIV